MIISLIAAMSEERVIGREGKLPWHIPADLARFKSLTMGHPVVMGRKTFESIGKPLPGRRNIILSRTLQQIEGCQIVRSLPEAISAAEGAEEIFICGGEEVFRQALPLCQRIYLTIVHEKYQGDTFFPELPQSFIELQKEGRQDCTPPITFLVYEKVERIQPGADVQELRQKGLEAVQRQLFFLGRRCFEQALSLSETPENSSDLAYCIAKSGGDLGLALRLAKDAVETEPENPRFYLNLGRVQILAGQRETGVNTLRRGVQLGGGEEFLAELARYDERTSPPIPSLSRTHPLNHYLGKFLHSVGIKRPPSSVD
jgi:dihydrofolate reductase